MRLVTDLSKGVLGQADSVVLWGDIISHIPDSVLLKPNVRILCVACGHGTTAIVLAKRMLALGISKEAVNDSLYLLDKYIHFTNFVKSKGFKNVITADFLTWETDMKFDVVVGNPPFQAPDRSGNPLWPEFVRKSFELVSENGIVAMITPGRWVLPGHNIKTGKIRLWDKYISKNQTIAINLGECSKHFSVGSSEDYFSYFVTQTTPVTKSTKIKTNTSDFDIDLSTVEWLPYRNCIETSISIFKKIASKNYPSFDLSWKYDRTHVNLIDDTTKKNKVKIFLGKDNIKYSDHKSDLHDDPKVLFKLGRFIPYMDRVYIDDIGDMSYNSAYVAHIDKDEDVTYLTSKLYQFIADSLFNGSEITAEGYRTLPRLPKKTWTDAELYAHFNLTQEEIDYIEANVK